MDKKESSLRSITAMNALKELKNKIKQHEAGTWTLVDEAVADYKHDIAVLEGRTLPPEVKEALKAFRNLYDAVYTKKESLIDEVMDSQAALQSCQKYMEE